MKKLLTLCLIYEHLPMQAGSRILLGMKKRGFGAGRWNGFGGKLKEGENLEQGAKRELEEETGITATEMEKFGILTFEFKTNGEIFEVHVFRVKDFSGSPKESEEMKPQWFDVADIPYGAMWPDDRFWLPLFLESKKFKGKFLFGENDVILVNELSEIENLE